MSARSAGRIAVVGIGADGLDGLPPTSRRILEDAAMIYGSPRHLDLVAELGRPTRRWPSPLLDAIDSLADEIVENHGVVVASGDPMFHGIGTTLARVLGPDRLDVYPVASSATLAAARMGWPAADLPTTSLTNADPHSVLRGAFPGGRRLVLARDGSSPHAVAGVLHEAGLGPSALTILSDLGARTESRVERTADELATGGVTHGLWTDLCVIAIEFRSEVEHPADPGAGVADLSALTSGLPDRAFDTDGQITKRHQRAHALNLLSPRPGERLWDVGGGSGSIAIEWLRVNPTGSAVSFELDPDRSSRIRENARRLGVPQLEVEGSAPESFVSRDDTPDAVFIGGGVTGEGVLEESWSRLAVGGRLVASAVTLESEAVLIGFRDRVGGELTRLGVEHAEPLGALTGWRPARAVVHLSVWKRAEVPESEQPQRRESLRGDSRKGTAIQ